MDKIINQMEMIEHKVSEMIENSETFQMLKDELQSLFIGLFVCTVSLAVVGTLVFLVLK
ncbi:MAG: hypothetical protein LBT76_06885 [Tannerella sp.]|nr:hypothetical protein [Tannerella sp.]